ncbi:gastrin-releasing peptide receptor-like [Diadema setosum]|uniref:gastrin-releasing peptide receptor-like n=1 Tax=Diadema setosum TaxID=31175 RepID=UPI003B3B6D4E
MTTSFVDTSHGLLVDQDVDNVTGFPNYSTTWQQPPSSPVNVAVVTFLIMQLVVGVPANISLIFLVARVRELRTTPNLLLANLAVGDVLFLLACTPVTIAIQMNRYYSSFEFCRFQHGVYYVSFAVSALSLTVISVERYGAIVKPFTLRSVRESRNTIAICIIIWVVSLLLFAVYPIYKTKPWGLTGCTVEYHSRGFKIFFIVQLTMLYLAPVFLMTIFYSLCTRELLRKRRILGNRSSGRGSSDRSRMRVAFNLMLITVLFAACWLPNYIYWAWFLYVENMESFSSPVFKHILEIRSLLYYIASCINPIVLYAMSSSFRHHLNAYITCSDKKTGRQRNGYVARCDTQRSVTLKSTLKIQEPSTRPVMLRLFELLPRNTDDFRCSRTIAETKTFDI